MQRAAALDRVRIKRAYFGLYVHHAAKANTVWYDDVALSTGYLGPLSPAPGAAERNP